MRPSASRFPPELDDLGSIVPDAIEPVTAWRAWCVERRPEGLRLRSVIRATCVWAPRVALEATCVNWGQHEEPSPFESCHCGVHALFDAKGVRPYLYSQETSEGDVWRVFGRVKLWGRTINGTRGVRAQYAYPYSLALPSRAFGFDPLRMADREEIARELREAYGVPVVVESSPFVRRLRGR